MSDRIFERMTERLKEPVLFVGDIDDDMDLSLPPASGEEYIKRVIIEAQSCDDVVVANISSRRLKNPTVAINPLAGCVEAPAALGPTLEWQQCQLADFSELRLDISRIRDEIHSSKRTRRPLHISLPLIDDRSSWVDFCSTMHRPSLTILMSMNQPLIEQVLEYLVEEMEMHKNISQAFGEWIYALLAVLDLPLNPETCSCLRSLARACSIIRAKMVGGESKEIAALNLFICLVARYFRQMDLADR